MAVKPGDRRIAVLVTYVIDGDSLRVREMRRNGGELEVRLFAIDAPEIGQRYSARARDYLVRIAQGRLFLDVVDIDQYGRVVAVAYRRSVKDSLNLAMVRAGWARYYPTYDRDGYAARQLGLEPAERRAAAQGQGIWQDPDYDLAPWEYRRIQRDIAARRSRGRRRAGRGGAGCLLVPALLVAGLMALLVLSTVW